MCYITCAFRCESFSVFYFHILNFYSSLYREFRLVLTPKKGILHSEFSASSVDENGEETPIVVGTLYFSKMVIVKYILVQWLN